MENESKPNAFKSAWQWLKVKPWRAVLVVFLMIGLIGMFVDEPPSEPAAKEESKPMVHNREYDSGVQQVEDYLRGHLKDWDSYQSVEWSKVIDNGPKSPAKSRYIVRHKYRAKNSFGGYEIQNELFTLDSTGNVTGVVAFPN